MVGKCVLMVEGPDDEHVVKNVCGQRQLGKIDLIQPYGGIDQLLEGIGVRIKESEITSLGIVVDADTDLLARWQAITHRLRTAGYNSVPTDPDPNGTVIHPSENSLLPRVGVWLMPDNRAPGILEDFLRFLVPEGDSLLAHAEECISGIPEPRRFGDIRKPKALIHTWLAWQAEPGKPFGQALSARYLDPNLPAGNIFADWLRRTFFL